MRFYFFVQVFLLFFMNPLMADERKTVYVFPPTLIGDSSPDLGKSLDDALRKELNKLHDLVHNPSYEEATVNFFSRQSDQALAHQRWTLSQNLDLRLEYDQIHDTREGKLALNFYW